MQKSTRFNLDGCSEGPTGTKTVKGVFSGPVSEVEAGVNLRRARTLRGQVVVHTPARRPGPGSTRSGGCGHSFPPPGGSRYPNSCRLGVDWVSGNRWAGRRCGTHHVPGFGCKSVTPELVCFPRILTTFEWDGFLGDHTRPPGLRQGTTVCVHTSMDV